mgnify:CR=1 FL=1
MTSIMSKSDETDMKYECNLVNQVCGRPTVLSHHSASTIYSHCGGHVDYHVVGLGLLCGRSPLLSFR